MATPNTGLPSGKQALPDDSRCPDPEELGAFIDRRLDVWASDRVERHLDECPLCFEVYANSVRVLFPEETEDFPQRWIRRRAIRRRAAGGMVAVAALLLLVFNFQRMSGWVYNRLGAYHYQKGALTLARTNPYELVRFQMPLPIAREALEGRTTHRGPTEDGALPVSNGDALSRAKLFFDIARKKTPNDPGPYLNLLSAMILTENFSGLDRVVLAVEALQGGRPELEAAVALAKFLSSPRDDAPEKEEALRAMTRLQRENPAVPAIAYNLGRMCFEMGRKAQARSAWASYLELEPEGPFAEMVRFPTD